MKPAETRKLSIGSYEQIQLTRLSVTFWNCLSRQSSRERQSVKWRISYLISRGWDFENFSDTWKCRLSLEMRRRCYSRTCKTRLERAEHYHDAAAFLAVPSCDSPIGGRSCFATPSQTCDREQTLLRWDNLIAGASPEKTTNENIAAVAENFKNQIKFALNFYLRVPSKIYFYHSGEACLIQLTSIAIVKVSDHTVL